MRHNYTALACLALLLISCTEIPVNDSVEDSLKQVDNVFLIEGAENTDVLINQGKDAMFALEITNVDSAHHWAEIRLNGWCIDWNKPINANATIYSGLKIYSTYSVESWKPINYLVNQIDSLYEADSELTYMEIQLTIWSLRGNPKFDLSKVALSDLPARFHRNGNPLFNKQKVQEILDYVENNFKDFEYGEKVNYAIIIETPAAVQTIIAIVN